MLPRSFEQTSCAFDVCPNERRGIQNGAIDVRFSGEVHDRIKAMLRKNGCDLTGIRYIGANEFVPRVFRDFVQIVQIACVRKQVIVHDLDVFPRLKDKPHEAGADETRSTGDKNLHILRLLLPQDRRGVLNCGLRNFFGVSLELAGDENIGPK